MFQCVYEVKPHKRTIKFRYSETTKTEYKQYISLGYTQFWFYCNNRLHVTSSSESYLHDDYIACHPELPNANRLTCSICQPIFSSHKRAIDFYWSSHFVPSDYSHTIRFCPSNHYWRTRYPQESKHYYRECKYLMERYKKSLYRKSPKNFTAFQFLRTYTLSIVK